MGDICSSQVTCLENDEKQFAWLGYRLLEGLDNGCIQLIDDQAPNGHCNGPQNLDREKAFS